MHLRELFAERARLLLNRGSNTLRVGLRTPIEAVRALPITPQSVTVSPLFRCVPWGVTLVTISITMHLHMALLIDLLQTRVLD